MYKRQGRQTARIAKAFGMEVLVCTRTVRPEYEADGVEFVDLDTLLARSDVLSLHCPATPATRGLINAATPVSYTHLDVYKRQVHTLFVKCAKLPHPYCTCFACCMQDLIGCTGKKIMIK